MLKKGTDYSVLSRKSLTSRATVGVDRAVDTTAGADCPALAGANDPAKHMLAGGNRTASEIKIPCQVSDLGKLGYLEALDLQRDLVERRKRGEIPDQLLLVEHPHVVTMGRNGHDENLLAAPELLARSGVAFHRTDRGGDATYHGPGQIVGYPIFDLREWKRDVIAYVRGLEQALIGTLAEFGIPAHREAGATGVWTGEGKIAAIGVHISRWVTSHGFALNVDTDLSYFRYIVPCGLTRPVTSMRALGCPARREEVAAVLARSFARVFERGIEETWSPMEKL